MIPIDNPPWMVTYHYGDGGPTWNSVEERDESSEKKEKEDDGSDMEDDGSDMDDGSDIEVTPAQEMRLSPINLGPTHWASPSTPPRPTHWESPSTPEQQQWNMPPVMPPNRIPGLRRVTARKSTMPRRLRLYNPGIHQE